MIVTKAWMHYLITQCNIINKAIQRLHLYIDNKQLFGINNERTVYKPIFFTNILTNSFSIRSPSYLSSTIMSKYITQSQ